MPEALDPSAASAPAAVPWISTLPELDAAARPQRSRLVRVKMPAGKFRVANVVYLHAAAQADGKREHLYRVALEWLAEVDTRNGQSEKLPARGTRRTANTIQFRAIETARPDGTPVVAVQLGPKGELFAEPRNIGLMSFLRAALVEWVAERHPDAVVLQGSLALPEPLRPDEQNQRDQFFERSGFTVQATSDGGGRFSAGSLRELSTRWNADKVAELTPAAIAEALCAQVDVAMLRKQLGGLEAVIAGLQREKKTAEFASRIWIAVTILAIAFGIVFGIQPRVA